MPRTAHPTPSLTVPPEPAARKDVAPDRPDLVAFFRERAPRGQAGGALKKTLVGLLVVSGLAGAYVYGQQRDPGAKPGALQAEVAADSAGQRWAVIRNLDEHPGSEIRIALPFNGITSPDEASIAYTRETEAFHGDVVCSTVTLHQGSREVFAGHFPASEGTVGPGEPAPTSAAAQCRTSPEQFGPAYDDSVRFSR